MTMIEGRGGAGAFPGARLRLPEGAAKIERGGGVGGSAGGRHMIYCKIKNGLVIDRVVFQAAIHNDWPDRESFVQNDTAQIGWSYDGSVFTPPVAPPPPEPTADQLRVQSFDADSDRQELLNRLRSATPAQIKSYVTSSVTDLASARSLLTKVLLVLSAPH